MMINANADVEATFENEGKVKIVLTAKGGEYYNDIFAKAATTYSIKVTIEYGNNNISNSLLKLYIVFIQ